MSFLPHKYSDEELMRMIADGNHDAFSVLVRTHVSKFYKTAFMLLKSKEDAEDVVQECFLKLWKDPQKWHEEKGVKFTSWFSRVITNRCYDFLRKNREEILSEDFDIADPNASAQDLVEMQHDHDTLRQAYLELSEKQQAAITLSFFQNRKNSESAQMMNLTLKAFQSLLMRSKETLRQNFKKLS